MQPLNQLNKPTSPNIEKILLGLVVALMIFIAGGILYSFTLNQKLSGIKNRVIKNLTNKTVLVEPSPTVIMPTRNITPPSAIEKEVLDVEIESNDEDLSSLQADLDQL